MKKLIFTSAMALLFSASFAQYKKASFLNKEGRTHELGTNFSFISNGGGSPVMSIVYSGSLEGEKNLSLFSDIELMLKGKLGFNAAYYNDLGVNTTGKLTGETPMYLLIRYGAQYRFVKSESSDDAKLVPYARLGLLYGIGFGNDYKLKDKNGNSVSSGNSTPSTPDHESPFGLEGGAGVTYYFAKNFGIKVGANYRTLFHISGINEGSSTSGIYYPLKSHPGISIALKYRVFRD
jgi:hypothetical protein